MATRLILWYWSLFGLVLLSVSLLAQPVPPAPTQPPYSLGDQSQRGIPFSIDHTTWEEQLGPTLAPQGLRDRTRYALSNALTMTWDGRVLMYQSFTPADFAGNPSDTWQTGYLFATFDPALIAPGPDFSPAIGHPFPRFVTTSSYADPSIYLGNDYPVRLTPTSTNFPAPFDHAYPYIPQDPASKIGSMGELGLLRAYDQLSNNLYPVPESELPAEAASQNPYPSKISGIPSEGAPTPYMTYDCVVLLQDRPESWDPNGINPATGLPTGKWSTTSGYMPLACSPTPCTPAPVTYPNGEVRTTPGGIMKRNGRAKIRIIVEPAAQKVIDVIVLEKWKPFLVETTSWQPTTTTPSIIGHSAAGPDSMWADNFEPTLTMDGHLMVGKGAPLLVTAGYGGSRVVFYYNQTAFGSEGWQGPYDLHYMYPMRTTVVDGLTLEERYPLARRPLKDYDGKVLGDVNGDGDLTLAEAQTVPFEGGYTWCSPDGRYVLYCVQSAGVGPDHPQIPTWDHDNNPATDEVPNYLPGGGVSNRGNVSIVGSINGWQCWRLDHAVPNPSRHLFTGWDNQSQTEYFRTAWFGFAPGFWDLLGESPYLPLRDNGKTTLQLVDSHEKVYYEVDLSPHTERDYGFYLPMQVMLDLDTSHTRIMDVHRIVDLSRTPDHSGNGNVGIVNGAKLPCEYFKLPTAINNPGENYPGTTTKVNYVPGLYQGAPSPAAIGPGWMVGDTIIDLSDPLNPTYWVPIADGKEGIINDITVYPPTFTAAEAGKGNDFDMDSDVCWGIVGQAMFFEDGSTVTVGADTSKIELHPGTTLPGAADGLTLSFWFNPLQSRTADVDLFDHNIRVTLDTAGRLSVSLNGQGVGWQTHSQSTLPPAAVNVWRNVIVTWEDRVPNDSSSYLYLLLDGDKAISTPLNFDRLATNTSQTITIGCPQSCATDPAQAVFLIDEVALKNSVVSEDDVRDLAHLPVDKPVWTPDPNLPTPPAPFQPGDERVPTYNQYDAQIASLGADLFHDVQLSGNKTVSCATCHVPELAFTDGLERAEGLNGQLLRNTQSIFNTRFMAEQFWDSRASNLEAQALQPIFDSEEMDSTWTDVRSYLEGDPDYLSRFNAHFGGGGIVQQSHVAYALATFMRSVTAGGSEADDAGPHGAGLNTSARNGRNLFFGKARCSGCHNGPNFTDGRLWTTGTMTSSGEDLGAFNANTGENTAGKFRFFGAFKTPTLRELTLTGPYFHDGSAATLLDVVEFYDQGGVRTDGNGYALSDPLHDFVAEEINRKLNLTGQEKLDLVNYLIALSSEVIDVAAAGVNAAPSVSVAYSGSGQSGMQTVTVSATDPDGLADLDPTMSWTLSVSESLAAGGTHSQNWSNTSPTIVGGAYEGSFTISVGSNVTIEAFDRHGLRSGTHQNQAPVVTIVSTPSTTAGWDDLIMVVQDSAIGEIDPTDVSSLLMEIEPPWAPGTVIALDWSAFTAYPFEDGYAVFTQVPTGGLKLLQVRDTQGLWSAIVSH